MFEILFIAAAVIEIPMVALFLKFYWPDRSVKSFTTKTVCSLLFVLCGVFAVKATGNNTLYADYMLWGLVLGMVGDLFLHSLTKKLWPFAVGVVAFLVGHIFYIAALQRAIYTTGFSAAAFTWYEILGIVLCIAGALAYAFRRNIFKEKGVLAVGLVVYGAVLVTMLMKSLRYVIGVIAYGTNDNMLMIALTVGVGAFLFVLSDTSLGVILSSKDNLKRGMRIFNIVTYYAAQILLAASLFFVYSRELY